jgi:hypothetical protein
VARAVLALAVAGDSVASVAELRHPRALHKLRARQALGEVRPHRRQHGARLDAAAKAVALEALRLEVDEHGPASPLGGRAAAVRVAERVARRWLPQRRHDVALDLGLGRIPALYRRSATLYT